MWRHALVCGLLLEVCVCHTAAAQKANKKAARPASPVLDSQQLHAGVFVGRLVSVPASDGSFTVEVHYQKVQPNPGAARAVSARNNAVIRDQVRIQQQVLRIQRDLATRHNPSGDLIQLQRLQASLLTDATRAPGGTKGLYTVKSARQRVAFTVAPAVKVRVSDLPQPFDNKGVVRKYTAAELARLKGKDSSLPGYEGSLADLKPGQLVRVTLSTVRQTAGLNPVAPVAGEMPAKKYLATRIVILDRNSQPAIAQAAHHKKK